MNKNFQKKIEKIRNSVIGEHTPFITPYGVRRITYCDFTAR